jgi:hypothetical protein
MGGYRSRIRGSPRHGGVGRGRRGGGLPRKRCHSLGPALAAYRLSEHLNRARHDMANAKTRRSRIAGICMGWAPKKYRLHKSL